MSDVSIRRMNPARSIFVTGVVIVALAVGVVCGAMYVLAGQTERALAKENVRDAAHEVTTLVAETLGGAVRFGNAEAVATSLDGLSALSGDRLVAAFVADQTGTTLGEIGGGAIEAGQDLAKKAITSARAMKGRDGMIVAVPIMAGADAPPVGAIVTEWSDASTIAEINAEHLKQLAIVGLLFAAVLAGAGLGFRVLIAKPLGRLAERTVSLADGDLNSDVPGKSRADEIGETARQLDTLRSRLQAADVGKRDAAFKGAGFQASSAALLMMDTALTVTHANTAFQSFASHMVDKFKAAGLTLDAKNPVGVTLDEFVRGPAKLSGALEKGAFPTTASLQMDDRIVELNMNSVCDHAGGVLGYILEWVDTTDATTNKVLIGALDGSQWRLDFAPSGVLRRANPTALGDIGGLTGMYQRAGIDGIVSVASSGAPLSAASVKASIFDTFRISIGGETRLLNGSLSPTTDRTGETAGFVLLGFDITDTEAAREAAEAETRAQTQQQQAVVEALTTALTQLADGDLSARLTGDVHQNYAKLREHFNGSVSGLDDAFSTVLDNASSILGEASNISDAAGDLSRRTEQQAATLEHFAAALAQITASVSSAAEGAAQAQQVVDDARKNAEASGTVVREAVEAMGEISSSSEKISRIIGVIDDIAFQTNLLALNAGVEAARAGDAGRGFAVVASEVRALAQRSSDAAREINELISTSGGYVKRGVSLVDKAGQALSEIVASVGGIAEHVATIATSAKEQSTGLDEINTAIGQLDQVTQQNVAMFEETTAATHTLTNEANTLVAATRRFKTSGGSGGGQHSAPAKVFDVEDLPKSRKRAGTKETPIPDSDGALALALDEGDWDDF